MKEARRASVSDGSRPSEDAAVMTPHTRPSTTIGVPTADRYRASRAAMPTGPEASAKSSIRAGRRVSNTIVVTFFPSGIHRVPTGKAGTPFAQAATVVKSPSGS
ncbi:MAG: hypothetical protein E6G08_00265 [Actinobacteria bacterium]|nr:MAG: hypothetical protein E6G08_00265 [Actinomycetota bacterium]